MPAKSDQPDVPRSPEPGGGRDTGPERQRALRRRGGTSRTRRSARAPFAGHLLVAAALTALAAFFLAWDPPVLAADSSAGGAGAGSSVALNLGIVFVLVLVTSLFVLAETAMLTVRRTRIEQLVEEGNRSARLASQLLAEPTRMLATLQVGVTLVQLFSAGAAAESAVVPLAALLRTRFVDTAPWVAQHAERIAFPVVILSVALVSLVVGEITPKSIGIRNAERIALFAARPICWLQTVAYPAVWLVNVLSRLLVRPFGGTVSFHTAAMSEEELKIMVEQSEEHGVIEAEEKEMIHSIFDFADTVVRKVMTPRLDISAVEADATVDELIRIVTESGHSRLLVFDDNLDNIVGIVHVKDVLRGMFGASPPTSVRELMRPAYFIPENKRVDDLLAEFRRSKIQLAVVRDEYGTVTGLVSLEDLLEEIVGEIQDEYDVEEEPLVTQVDDRTSIVDGRVTIEDFNDRMGVELPVEESDTLGGFVFGLLGHQPEKGEGASWDGLDFSVEATDGRRIQKVRVTRSATLPAADEEGAAGNDLAGGEGVSG